MKKPLKVLIVDNSEDDVAQMVSYLRRKGYEPDWKAVQTSEDFGAALTSASWELILSDYRMPGFTWLDALGICRSAGYAIPFILVSRAIGEEKAVEALQAGADDYIMKDRIQRLAAAVGRALREASIKQESRRAEAEILRLNAELREKVELLSRSNAELEQFATAASHDLKEPLRTVTMYTQLLVRKKVPAPGSDEAEYAHYIKSAVDRMRALIDGLLAYSKIAHKSRDDVPLADANVAASDALVALRGAIEENRAAVTLGDLPMVAIESVLLTQVFQNLIGNAVKYRRPGEPPAIHVSAEARDDNVCFSVRDNGIGISRAHYERIFVLFRRLHGDEYPGIGLGLAVCKRIVENCGGKVWLESEPGAGSTFYFTLLAGTEVSTASGGRSQRKRYHAVPSVTVRAR